jgi:serine/threonine protein kinase
MRLVTAKDAHTDESMQLKYIKQKTVGTGTFGTVILAKFIPDHNDQVAIKQVLQDKRYKVSPFIYIYIYIYIG